MPEWFFIWDDEDEHGNVAHLAEHGVSREEFKQVVRRPDRGPESSLSNPAHTVVWGWTDTGRYLMAVYLVLDEATVLPITAYEQTPMG